MSVVLQPKLKKDTFFLENLALPGEITAMVVGRFFDQNLETLIIAKVCFLRQISMFSLTIPIYFFKKISMITLASLTLIMLKILLFLLNTCTHTNRFMQCVLHLNLIGLKIFTFFILKFALNLFNTVYQFGLLIFDDYSRRVDVCSME